MITPCTGHAAESERDEWKVSILERLQVCGLPPGCPDCGRCLVDVGIGA